MYTLPRGANSARGMRVTIDTMYTLCSSVTLRSLILQVCNICTGVFYTPATVLRINCVYVFNVTKKIMLLYCLPSYLGYLIKIYLMLCNSSTKHLTREKKQFVSSAGQRYYVKCKVYFTRRHLRIVCV